MKVRSAVKVGKLQREPCSICGSDDSTCHAHHDNYERPLDVRWVCNHCHTELHRIARLYPENQPLLGLFEEGLK